MKGDATDRQSTKGASCIDYQARVAVNLLMFYLFFNTVAELV